MKVNICGIPHEVIEKEDAFDSDIHFGMIRYGRAEITVNKNLPEALKKEALCHEMVHGILIHIGYNELSENEQFVQALGNAICQGFEIEILDDGGNKKCGIC